MNKLVTILMTSYNHDQHISKAIDSVLRQTYSNWELLIVDDGSTDKSLSIIKEFNKKYSDKIKLLCHPDGKHKNLVETYRLGFENVTGEYVAFLESDDLWCQDSLEIKVDALNRQQGAFLAFTDVVFIGEKSERAKIIENGLFIRQKFSRCRCEKLFYALAVADRNVIPTFSSVLFRSEYIANINFSLPEEYNVWFDWWLWGHLSLSGKFLYIPEKKTKWRIHSSSYNSLNDKKIKNDDNYLERFKVYLKNSLCSCLEQQGQSEFMRYLFREAIYSKKGKEAMLIEQIREIERSKSWRLIQSFRKTRRQITQFPDFLNKFRKVFQHRYCSEKMTRDDNFLYIVLHIPKAAGTTLRMHFENCFGFDRVVSFYEDDDNFENRQQSRDYLRDLSSKDKQKIKMIYGHTACYGLHKYFNRPYRYITFLRDPVDRMISMYNYRMGLFYSKGEWTKEFFTKSGERQKFKDWIEVIPGYKNQLLRILLQDTDFDQNSRSLAEQLEKAKDILRKFWFIGFVEDFKNDSSYLCKELGIPNCQIRKNVTKTKYLAENYEEVRKFVLSFSPIDKEIYDYALALKRNRQRSK